MEELSLKINHPDDGKFLQQIGWNKEQITKYVSEVTDQYKGIAYTDEQIPDAKKDRAALNALKKNISDGRIQVKNALMAPYYAFESEVKEVVALIDEPISLIDKQVAEYEEKVRDEKREELRSYFDQKIGALAEKLSFDMIFNTKWLNKSVSLKSCKEEIDKAILRTDTDLRTIDTMVEEKYRAYAADYYLQNGRDITAALNKARRMGEIGRKAELEKAAREEAEERRREQEATKATEQILQKYEENIHNQENDAQKPDEIAQDYPESVQARPETARIQPESGQASVEEHGVTDPFADKETDMKIYKASFTIRGTKAQILAVKEFMMKNNIQFGKVEK